MMADGYLWSRALHVIGFVAWLGSLWYLPRLYAQHHALAPGSEGSELLKGMERRLLKVVGTPAMVATFAFGIWVTTVGGNWTSGWLHAKLTLVLVLAGIHGLLAADLKRFARDERPRSARVYGALQGVSAILVVLVVVLAVFRPF